MSKCNMLITNVLQKLIILFFSFSRACARARNKPVSLRAHARERNDMIPYSRYDVVQEREIFQGAFSLLRLFHRAIQS